MACEPAPQASTANCLVAGSVNGASSGTLICSGGASASCGGIGSLGITGLTGPHPLAAPIVALAPTPSGSGYWMVDQDAGVFTFGDATHVGSLPQYGISTRDAVNLVPTSSGYPIVLSTGAVVSFPD